jgi:cytochrome c oxidase subunit 4
MAISCTKASLVILFFMHLKYEANWKYVLTIPAGMMSIFLMLMLVPDVGMRRDHYTQQRHVLSAEVEDKDDHGKSHAADEKTHKSSP